ncbi:hypothetical protein [Enterococcus casseliflavus]|uniref:hypothetical protein n=1 Tax=Enterococcus casseliflavus TaxID=37734 RepID=UPI0023D8670E|nr:hypothetical protein [Enterococcus casseliflavus]WEI91856.1 hypothetical protein PZY29_14160 [Enterococcus casseliflavus]
MSEKKRQFMNLYKTIILEENGYMNAELNKLFDELLEEEFGNKPELMSEFIQSIVNKNSSGEPDELEKIEQEIKDIRQQMEIMQNSLLKISKIIYSN